ncbi:hypothetical protein AB5J55_41725 [Streptomyces sp. R11]|uniref:Uncharacterized protein n=1 Tax=Streptomyces sp. R11 TaxID=3238625 RepID=A0AB39NB36_9ACTN
MDTAVQKPAPESWPSVILAWFPMLPPHSPARIAPGQEAGSPLSTREETAR